MMALGVRGDRMGKIIMYELTKFFNKRKNKLLILALFLFVLGANIYNYKLYKHYNDRIVEEYRIISEKAKSKLQGLYNELMVYREWGEGEGPFYKERIKSIEGEMNFLKIEFSVTGRISNDFRNVGDPQWNRIICKYLSQRYANIIESYEKGYIDDTYLRDRKTNIEEARYNRYKYDYFLENKIPLQENKYEPNGVNSINLFFEDSNILILVIIIALLSMDVFLSPVIEGSYKLECTNHFERKNIFIGKVITIFLIMFSILAVVLLLGFLINSFIFGIGDFNYPQVVSGSINELTLKTYENNFTVISMSRKILLGVLMIVALIFFTIALIMMLSIFTDSTEKTLGVTMILIITAFTFNITADMESIVNLLHPYMYCFYENVISGFYRSNYLFGIIINIGLGMLFILISYFRFTRKDFLG